VTITTLITKLQQILEEHGDLRVACYDSEGDMKLAGIIVDEWKWNSGDKNVIIL